MLNIFGIVCDHLRSPFSLINILKLGCSGFSSTSAQSDKDSGVQDHLHVVQKSPAFVNKSPEYGTKITSIYYKITCMWCKITWMCYKNHLNMVQKSLACVTISPAFKELCKINVTQSMLKLKSNSCWWSSHPDICYWASECIRIWVKKQLAITRSSIVYVSVLHTVQIKSYQTKKSDTNEITGPEK